MAETAVHSPLKRQREEHEQQTIPQEDTKRQKPSSSSTSYNQVHCLLDDEEAENDLASLITTLQQELSTDDTNAAVFENPALSSSSCSSSSSSSCVSKGEEYESDKEKVMKHLLEASDDELGIPSTEFGGSNYEKVNTNETNQDYVNEFSLLDGFCDGLWELEDEAANYYTLLQSELFM